MEATWPPAASRTCGGWRLRDGAGGGSRVSAATAEERGAAIATLPANERLVMVRPGEEALDAALAAAGWVKQDATLLYAGPVAARPAAWPDGVTALAAPDAGLRATWAGGGIGAARLAVMTRATPPRAWLRADEAGAAFIARGGGTAFVHAVEVRATARGHGIGRRLMSAAAAWACEAGATRIACAVTEVNGVARALYEGCGMRVALRYHYRRRPG